MSSYRPYKKTSNVTTEDLPLDAETVKGVDVVAQINAIKDGNTLDSFGDVENALANLPSGDSSGGITEISTEYIRITDLTSGVYKLTYNGVKYLYYRGTSSTSSLNVPSLDECIIIISKVNSNIWNWYFIIGTQANYRPVLYSGYTTSTGGSYTNKTIENLLTSHQSIKTINGTSLIGSGNVNVSATLYRHNIIISWSDNFYIFITVINSQATAYTKTTFGQYLSNGYGEIWVSGWDKSSNQPIYEFGGGTWGFEYWYLGVDESISVPSSAGFADNVTQA